jgi:hypothetical protein
MSRRVDIWELLCHFLALAPLFAHPYLPSSQQTSNAQVPIRRPFGELDLCDQLGTDGRQPSLCLIDGDQFNRITDSTLGSSITNAITRFREAVNSGPEPRIPHSPANACAGNGPQQPHGKRSIRLAGGLERKPHQEPRVKGLLMKATIAPAYRAVALQPVGVCIHLLFMKCKK